MELKQELESKGFAVYCIFPTHLWSIFEVEGDGATLRSTIEGEANFRTNYGDIDVAFMPKPQTFANFKMIYFLDHANGLFFVGDVALLHRLEKVLKVRHRGLWN